MKLLALDISGNFHEGKGTTGLCLMEDGECLNGLGAIEAKSFSSIEEYWSAHKDYILSVSPDHVVIEGYKLYNHKGKEAKIQANSNLETPQLLGYLKMVCWETNTPYTIQYASDVKTRWSEDVLVRLGILEQRGNKYYFNGKSTVTHHRDSLKHALHWWNYNPKGKKALPDGPTAIL